MNNSITYKLLAKNVDSIRLSGIIEESIVNGTGFRFVVFLQGCHHNCEGCHNKDTHDFNGGYTETNKNLLSMITKNKLLSGVTVSGGEPFLQPFSVYDLVQKCVDNGLNVWIYSGFTFEELISDNNKHKRINEKILHLCDVLVDGKFKIEEVSLMHKFRGSKNQRLIDLKKTFDKGEIITIL